MDNKIICPNCGLPGTKKGFNRSGTRSYKCTNKDCDRDSYSETKVKVTSTTNGNDYNNFILTAWNSNSGVMMDINTYCNHYKLPREDVSSYKLVSHTGTPYYNIVFREKDIDISEINFDGVIDRVINGLDIKPLISSNNTCSSDKFTRLIYTDTHIGMNTNSENTAMYATVWNKESILKSVNSICIDVISNKVGDVLHIDDLGDFLDGFDGYTTRGGHKLPQNMTNEEAFELALEFKMKMLMKLHNHFDKIICHNICNDNHAGSFGAVLNHAFKIASELKFSNVEVINIKEFIGHYIEGKHAFILTHGKDKKSLKFGFKPQLDPKQIEKIDHYLKYNSIFSKAKFIEFSKGDSHQLILDYSTSQDFHYFNYPALSPSSEWVQNNFKRGIRGFIIQQIDRESNNKVIIPKFL